MTNKVNTDAQLQRMKALMTYGINESKEPTYSTVEYNKTAADGKMYGIVREGTHYFIKVAKDPQGKLIAENFDYIGGFRNRKDNMFESFAAAQRYFGEKMININENVGSTQKQVIEENYINEKGEALVEATNRMQAEIARQRQIMANAQNIMEEKEQSCEPVKGTGTDKNSASPKCKAKQPEETVVDYNGKPFKKCPSAPFTVIGKPLTESLDDIDTELDDETAATDLDDNDDVEYELETDDADVEDGDLSTRIDGLESKLDTILDAITNMKYDDDDELYDDDEDDTDDDEDDLDDTEDFDDDEPEDNVVESKAYRKMRIMNEASEFGKHPKYGQTAIELVLNDTSSKKNGNYSMDDDSLNNTKSYGRKKGSTSPFTQSPKKIENEIVENALRSIKKKLG